MHQNGPIGHKIGIGSRVRLHIGVITAKEALCLLRGKLLHAIYLIAPRIKAVIGRPFGILVRKKIAHGKLHGKRREILRSDQLQVGTLILQFRKNRIGNLGRDALQMVNGRKIGYRRTAAIAFGNGL